MSDDELIAFLGLDGDPLARRIVETMSPTRRAVVERMKAYVGEAHSFGRLVKREGVAKGIFEGPDGRNRRIYLR